MDEYMYDAFISYSHRDIKWARWLQRRLEGFRIPRKEEMERAGQDRLKTFRDQTDLTGTELQAALRREMRASRYMIVICSPLSAASRWVNEEAEFFTSLGRGDRIIPFIVDGEPDSDNPELECFPPVLRNDGPTEELLGINIHEIGKRNAFLKVVSVLLGMRFNRLADREKKSRIRRITGITAAAVIAVSVTGYLLLTNYEIKRKNQEIEKENRELSDEALASAMGFIRILDKDIDENTISVLERVVETGNADAMVLLGDCYKNGLAVEKNEQEAFAWYTRAAEQGSPEGMIATASCMFFGIGTEVDQEQATEWYRKAAEAGHMDAMADLADCYMKGTGVEKDEAEAAKWYQQAAEKGHIMAMVSLAMCYHSGLGVEADQEKAFYWQMRLAEEGEPYGMYNVGLMYREGIGVEKDLRQAYLWLRKAAESGWALAMPEVAKCIENGEGVDSVALDWYERAVEAGITEAEKDVERLKKGE